MTEKNAYQEFVQALSNLDLPTRSVKYREKLYAALCNLGWKNADNSLAVTFSFRAAGGEIAALTNHGEDYLDYYCSGQEGHLAYDIEKDLNNQGWYVCPFEEALSIQVPEEKSRWLIKYRTPILLKQQGKQVVWTQTGKESFIVGVKETEEDTLEVEIDLETGESKHAEILINKLKEKEDFSDYPFEAPRYNEEEKSLSELTASDWKEKLEKNQNNISKLLEEL